MKIFPEFLMLLNLLVLTGGCAARAIGDSNNNKVEDTKAVTDSTLIVLVDASYSISHGWGHVFSCTVKEVLCGELEDSIFSLSVYGTVELYGDLLLPFQNYQDLTMEFEYNPERECGPPPGFRDSRNNYWELKNVYEASVLSTQPTISNVFPECYGWADFEDKASVYNYIAFPDLQHHHYRQMNPERWVAELESCESYDSTTGYVQVWNENGNVRFIRVTNPYPDGGRFFSFNGDTVDAATIIDSQGRLFMTEVGICKWRYIYTKGLLDKIVYYRSNISSPVWAVDKVEYRPGSNLPEYIYRYEEPVSLDISKEEWKTRTVYDREGKIIRKEDSRGKVLWERKSK